MKLVEFSTLDELGFSETLKVNAFIVGSLWIFFHIPAIGWSMKLYILLFRK